MGLIFLRPQISMSLLERLARVRTELSEVDYAGQSRIGASFRDDCPAVGIADENGTVDSSREHPLLSLKTGKRIIPSGTIRDGNGLPRGY